ncbi:MAG: 2-oxoacid:acceptor oxidoreductase family protein [Armatimonadota bacterium]
MSGGHLYHELLIAGFGGQGVVLAGRLLATAALSEGREVVWAPSYGPEMRGGAVHCTIIVSSSRIGSPEVSQADSLLIMDNTSMQKFAGRMKPGGLLVVNSSLVTAPESFDARELIRVPANEAAEALGDLRVANVIMLGAFLRVRPVISAESLVGAMRLFAPKGKEHLIEINTRALERGAELAGTTAP